MASKREVQEYKDKIDGLYKLLKQKNGQIKHYCNIVSSKEIKKALINRCTELGITPYEVCERADLKWYTFKKNYLECDEPKSSPATRAADIIRFARLIGIHIRIDVILDKKENVNIENLKNDKIRVNDTHK